MEGELLYLQIVSEPTPQFTASVYLLGYNINECMI